MRHKFIDGLLIVAVLVVAWIALSPFLFVEDPALASARKQAELERIHTLAPYETGMQVFYTLLPALLIVGVLALTGYALHKHFSHVQPDERGLYPVHVKELSELARLAATGYHNAQITAALHSQPHTPQTVTTTYAPALTYKVQNDTPQVEALRGGVIAPAFSTLLASGQIGQGQPLLLGYGESGAITGSWKDLYSAAIAGISGSGKTTTLRFLAAQSVLHGGKFLVVDPHADAGNESLAGTLQPLSGAFLREPATDDKAILQTVRYAQNRLQARIKGQESDHSPIIVAVDEFTSLMRSERLTEPLGGLLEAISQEGRKVGVFALLSGQIWSADRAGGSTLRDSLASAYIHRIKRRQAGMLLGIGDRMPDTSDLPVGQAYLLRTSGEIERLTIPQTTGADIEQVGKLLNPTSHHFQATSKPLPTERLEVDTDSPLRTPREAEILNLLATGKSQREIILQVFGASGGNAYMQASREVGQVIGKLAQSHMRGQTA